MSRIDLIQGDCLTESEKIKSGSVDLILTDLPYGNMKNAPSTWDADKTKWDTVIEPKEVYAIANRILRKNGKTILFSQEPYTTRLITEAIPNLPFGYRMIWEKDHFANSLIAKKAPVSYYEDILIFSKTHDAEGLHPLRDYFEKVLEYIGETRSKIIETIGQRADHTFRTNSTQYALCTEATYDALITEYGIDRMDGFIPYENLSEIDRKTKDEHFPSIFNLWEGNKYKPNILKYRKDYDGYHPTQKPVALLEDLIKTFSNEGDTVVDLTMGSGSTGVACLNTNRRFIGIELDEDYYDIATNRIKNHKVTDD